LGGAPSTDNRTAKLWAADPDGALALSAEADFECGHAGVTAARRNDGLNQAR
jgi:hypothetical protein